MSKALADPDCNAYGKVLEHTGIIDVVSRMHELAIQAADGSSSAEDKSALQGEFGQMFDEYWNLLGTKYNGEDLLVITPPNNNAKLFHPMKMQVGDSAADSITVDLTPSLYATLGTIGYSSTDLTTILTQHASQAIDDSSQAIDRWSAVRSAIGASVNMLEHASANASNILTNTKTARGRIMDTDYAQEVANSTQDQMLAQSSAAMLKQSSSAAQLIASLIQN